MKNEELVEIPCITITPSEADARDTFPLLSGFLNLPQSKPKKDYDDL